MKTMEALENLVKTRSLSKEAPDQREFDGMVRAAKTKLQDARLPGLSADSQFSLAYSAAHALALAALRWHGYRSDKRYTVFQCLPHTLDMSTAKWRILDICHNRRNLAEYEGHLEIDQQLLRELIQISEELLIMVQTLRPVQSDV